MSEAQKFALDYSAFCRIMAGLGETYEKKISKGLAEIYWNIFNKYQTHDFSVAVQKHMHNKKSGAWWPKPVDILKFLDAEPEEPNIEEQGELAWGKVMQALERVGPHQTFKTDDLKLLNAIRTLGGWANLCEKEFDQLTWIKKEFLRVYPLFEKDPSELRDRIPGVQYVPPSSEAAKINMSNVTQLRAPNANS